MAVLRSTTLFAHNLAQALACVLWCLTAWSVRLSVSLSDRSACPLVRTPGSSSSSSTSSFGTSRLRWIFHQLQAWILSAIRILSRWLTDKRTVTIVRRLFPWKEYCLAAEKTVLLPKAKKTVSLGQKLTSSSSSEICRNEGKTVLINMSVIFSHLVCINVEEDFTTAKKTTSF